MSINPTCQECGVPVLKEIPKDLLPTRDILRKQRPLSVWCPECLREAPVYQCKGCGKSHFSLGNLSACPSCKTP